MSRPGQPGLLFVDDHPLYRMGFELAMTSAFLDVRIHVAADVPSAIAVLDREEIDLCLADYRLPGTNGLAFLEKVGREFPSVGRGLLCSEVLPALADRARSAGLAAFLSKARDMDGLAAAIRTLFDGETVFDDTLTDAPGSLTKKRRHILELASNGHTNKDIARLLAISERTVKDHWANIFVALTVNNRAEAVSEAHRRGLI